MTLDPSITDARDRAAAAAAAAVRDGMIVGLGTGDTAARAIRAIGARVAAGELATIVGVATSRASEALARSLGITVRAPDDVAAIDLTIDGADEVDGALRLVKGAGGALTREKIVARASRELAIVIDAGKRVATLGARMRLPVEILPFGTRWTTARIAALGLAPSPRAGVTTDNGGAIVDCTLGAAPPEAVAAALDALPGVIEHGLFLSEATRIYVGHPTRVEVVTR